MPRKAEWAEMEARVALEGTPLSHKLGFYLAHGHARGETRCQHCHLVAAPLTTAFKLRLPSWSWDTRQLLAGHPSVLSPTCPQVEDKGNGKGTHCWSGRPGVGDPENSRPPRALERSGMTQGGRTPPQGTTTVTQVAPTPHPALPVHSCWPASARAERDGPGERGKGGWGRGGEGFYCPAPLDVPWEHLLKVFVPG